MVGTTDSWVIKSDGMGSCALTQTLASSIFGFPFLENAGLVFWMDNFDAATDSGEGWLANPDGCPAASKKKFSNAIDFWFVDGDKGDAVLGRQRRAAGVAALRSRSRAAPWPRRRSQSSGRSTACSPSCPITRA